MELAWALGNLVWSQQQPQAKEKEHQLQAKLPPQRDQLHEKASTLIMQGCALLLRCNGRPYMLLLGAVVLIWDLLRWCHQVHCHCGGARGVSTRFAQAALVLGWEACKHKTALQDARQAEY